MGIKNYYKWLNTLDCKLSCDKNFKYDYIYVDTNHIIYLSITGSPTYEEFIQELKSRVYHIITNFMARKGYVFCFDGPAAYAKIVLQKKRRLTEIQNIIDKIINTDNASSVYSDTVSTSSKNFNYQEDTIDKDNMEEDEDEDNDNSNKNINININNDLDNFINANENNSDESETRSINMKPNQISFLSLTPGTPFMNKLMEDFVQIIHNIENQFKFMKTKFKVLTSNLADEGEIKVFKELHQNNKINPNSTHLVIGNDADLIVLAVATKIPFINVMTKYLGSHILFSIDKFVNIIIDKYFDIDLAQFDKNLIDNLKDDIALLSLMLGNDYLPKVKKVLLKNIWSTYSKCFKELISVNIDVNVNTLNYETMFKNTAGQVKKLNHNFFIKFFGEYANIKQLTNTKKKLKNIFFIFDNIKN